MTRAWLRYLAVGAALALLQAALPLTMARDALIVLAGASAVAALLVGVRTFRPPRRLPWYLMAAGIACWTLGDAGWMVLVHVLGTDPFPSVADVTYLAAYPLLAAGMYALTRDSHRRTDHSAVVDALLVATAIGLLLWIGFIAPSWTDPEGTMLERVVGVAYPIGDLVLITQLAHLAGARGARAPALRLLGGAFVTMFIADLLFQSAAYIPPLEARLHWLDPLWIGAYLLWGAAALHPSMRSVEDAPRATHIPLTARRVAFLAVIIVVLPGIVLVEAALGLPAHTMEVTYASFPLIALVMLRMLGMVRRMRDQSDRLAHLADTDFLTGLENMRRLTARIDDLIAPAGKRAPGTAALLLVAVERFAEINETLGMRSGDDLLRAVGQRLVAAVADDGVVARLGGESFGVLLPAAAFAVRATERAADLRAAFAEPFVLPEVTVSVDVSVGIAMAPGDATNATDLLQRADVALSAARERREQIARYAEQMETGGALTPQLMSELTAAMAENQVVVHFQPQVELTTGSVLGVEALVRWQHPEHGLLAPIAFVPAAERTGLIRPLTLHVLDRSLAQAALWRAAGRDISVSVNLSVRNLLDPDFVDDVRRALDRHRIPAGSLELEITETMAMLDPNRSVEVLGALDALGVLLSIDDYGTGYSSLAYLQRLPVRRLKIDRSFVAGVLTDPASAAIVRSTIELARHLGLSVVAEGVEDDRTLLALLGMGCYAAQGFGLGRPGPGEQMADLIDAIEARIPELVRVRIPVQRSV